MRKIPCFLLFLTLWLIGAVILTLIFLPRDGVDKRTSNENNCCSHVQALSGSRASAAFNISLPIIYVITPTYKRPVQKAELVRSMHTFMLVPNLHWIIVEDAPSRSPLVSALLAKSSLSYTHLNTPTPQHMKLQKSDKPWSKPRGIWQRNEALRWIREKFSTAINQSNNQPHGHTGNSGIERMSNQPMAGILYFADDDNTYSLELFQEIRSIRSVGVWPVAFVGELLVEKPVVRHGKVTGWDVAIAPQRPFATDMAGFAVSLRIFLTHPTAQFDENQPVGYQETHFLKSLDVVLEDLEPMADNCTKVLVWHTRTRPVQLEQETRWNRNGRFSAGDIEY